MSELTSSATQLDWVQRYSDAVMNTFGQPQRVLVRGEGCYVWDADGARYLDLLGGIAVNTLGQAHPTVTGAIAAQLHTLGHISNFFASPTQIALAEKLLQIVVPGGAPQGSRVFFTNSGTESMEAAVKLARKHGGATRPRIIALEKAFHGRSLGALSLTHKAAYKEPFGPMPLDVVHIPADVDALEQVFAADGDSIAAFVAEPIQGEGGVLPLPEGFLARARELTTAHGALLILDEIQSGMGRTGAWMAFHHESIGGGIVPDVVALAKGLGAGFPMGAVIALGEGPATTLTPGNHGTTFGGNPVAAAAGLATIAVIERDGLLAAVTERGRQLLEAVSCMQHTLLAGVRGFGLLAAIELAEPVAAQAVTAALSAGFIVNAVTPSTLRIAAPYVLTQAQLGDFIAALPAILDAAMEVPA